MSEKQSIFTRVATDTGLFSHIQEKSKRSNIPPFMMERKRRDRMKPKDQLRGMSREEVMAWIESKGGVQGAMQELKNGI